MSAADGRFPARAVRLLAGIVVCSGIVRAAGLLQHSTMPDEAFTFFIAAHPLPAIFALLRSADFHPPLIYIIGHVLFAFSQRAYLFRIVTALFGLAGVLATYAVARRCVPRSALFAALLVGCNATLVFFDGFFRMYAPLWALSMIAWACLLWALDGEARWQRWAAYAGAAAALLYTQYLAFFIIAAQCGYVLALRRRSRAFWFAIGAAFAVFAPWIPTLLVQYPLGGSAYAALRGHWDQIALLPALLLIDGVPLSLETSPWTTAALWLLILAGLWLVIRQRQWLLLFLVTPLLAQFVYSLGSGKLLLGQRYLIYAVPPLVLLVLNVAGWLQSRPRARFAGSAIVAALLTLALAGTADKHFLAQYKPLDWGTYRQFLETHMQPGDGIVFDGALVYYVLYGSTAVNARPVYLVSNATQARAAAHHVAGLRRVWYVDYQSELPDPQHVAFHLLAKTHPERTSWRSIGSGYGDVVLTTLFVAPRERGPKRTMRT
ncbi:MAG: glycosyltransferase family 39 protein [Candidatus Eremiobacteraeota bacterium]|nr:glycosyltransferase family 39 protein [Candidatus Eremiobacteraeota bacterium]